MDLERIAYESSLRALDQQESLLEEIRGRTGILLAASALAASFLGDTAFRDPEPAVAIAALLGFVASVGASVFILVPRANQFVFAVSGPNVYVELFEFRDASEEIYRRLGYDFDRFWSENDRRMQPLFRAYRVGAAALVAEILALVALVSDSIL